MAPFNFITVRLGKDSIPDIKKICESEVGVLVNTFTIDVKCTQVPDNYGDGDYAFLWLGSDNNKGMPTLWKQGFKAVGRVKGVKRGLSYNDTSETRIDIVYIFYEAVNRMDILRCAPVAYYWCSSMPLIGLDDHANQTIRNMIGSSFSDIRAFFYAIESVTKRFKDDIIKIEPAFAEYFSVVLPCPQSYPLAKNIDDIPLSKKKDTYHLQQIFYGAPGTGKSHEVKMRTGELSDNGEEQDLPNVFRTTFHPDTDYASFVGCYKPTMRKTGKKHQVDGKDVDDEEIIYEFVPQTFADAYVYAYKNPTEQTYLVIEEINRGNCAQIFGDLFQLLDRKGGVSEYKIKADKDLAKYLNEELGKDADGIKDGKLCLPANLNILATMNTSDQSLFPIDSAFKRRWEWKYIKITNGYEKKNNGEFKRDIDGNKIKLDWKIETNGEDWYGFICQINRIISNMTSSADKQLGYFFCQANADGKITTETFVSKVIFYLWNDVFKDYGFDEGDLFKYKKLDEDGNRVGDDLDLTFPDFYDEDGDVVSDVVKQFIEHVMAWEKDKKKD